MPQIMAALGRRRVIRVDGHSGMGKSRIAKEIVRTFDWKRVEGDEFLDHPRNGRLYHDQVKKNEFAAAARAALEIAPGVVLDAICLDFILQPNSLGPELRVYMESITAPEFSKDERARNRKLGSTAYHLAVDPRGAADIVVTKHAKW